MANLIVRDIDPSIVLALKQRAAKNGRSAEAEHREILAMVLGGARKRPLAEVLLSIPAVGTDADFERVDDKRDTRHVPR